MSLHLINNLVIFKISLNENKIGPYVCYHRNMLFSKLLEDEYKHYFLGYYFRKQSLATVSGCEDPTPENGLVNTSSTSYETAVYVTCEKGYKLIGEESIVCQSNGTWSNQPACKLIGMKNGSIFSTYNSFC